MYGAGVTPPAASVGAVSVGTGGACPLSVASLTDGAVGALDSAVTVSTDWGWVRKIRFLV